MDDDTIVTGGPEPEPEPVRPAPPPNSNPWRRWWLPALLALLILAIVAGAYLASHPHAFGGSPTRTPTPTVTSTPKPRHTATPTSKPRRTATPTILPTATAEKSVAHTPTATAVKATAVRSTATPLPTATATIRPTSTPRSTSTPAATATPTGVRTGQFALPPDQLQTIQHGAAQGDPAYTPYLDPFKALQKQIGKYGFLGTVTVHQPPPEPAPTPTPYPGAAGAPSIKFTIEYQGKQYYVVLNQPGQQGPKGAWILFRILPV